MLSSSSASVCRSLLLRRSGATTTAAIVRLSRGTVASNKTTMAANHCLAGSSSWRRTLSTDKSGADNKAAASKVADTTEPEPPMSIAEEPSEPAIIDETVRMRNNGMAVVLVGVCVGIAYYSMNAVGQGGANTSDGSGGDPLASLKQEAAIAARDQQRKDQETTDSLQMVEQFQKGAYDPDDAISEEGDEDAPKKTKKPWWKFWSRS